MVTISGASLIVLVLIAGVCGAIGKALAGNVQGGLLTSIALGFIVALIGTWAGGALGLPEPILLQAGGRPFPIVWAIIGAALFVAVLHILKRRRSWLRV